MGKCTHQHKKSFSWLPTTLTHNHDDHDCGCVKCYLTDIVSIAKIQFVWMIEYEALYKIFVSESKRLKTYLFCSSFTTRSPPLYK